MADQGEPQAEQSALERRRQVQQQDTPPMGVGAPQTQAQQHLRPLPPPPPMQPAGGPVPMAVPVSLPSCTDSYWHYNVGDELYSRKVFIGGLPADCDDQCLRSVFGVHGRCEIDWPRGAPATGLGGTGGGSGTAAGSAPRGYCFVLYESEASVRRLVDSCHVDNDKYYVLLNTHTGNYGRKPVQVRPWLLADAEYIVDPMQTVDPRHCVFIGGLPRPVKAVEVANIVDQVFGGVCYVGIDTDPEQHYPKGAARVAFTYQAAYLSAMSGRYVTLSSGETPKRVEIKPYVVEDMQCDECHGAWCDRRAASIFCADLHCLQYYCEHCWQLMHTADDQDNAYRARHTPMFIRPDHYNQNRRGTRSPYCANGNGQQSQQGTGAQPQHNRYHYGNDNNGAQQQYGAHWPSSSSVRAVGRPSDTHFAHHRGTVPLAGAHSAHTLQQQHNAHALAVPLLPQNTMEDALRWSSAGANATASEAQLQAAVAHGSHTGHSHLAHGALHTRHNALLQHNVATAGSVAHGQSDNNTMLPPHFPMANAQQHNDNTYAGGVYAMGGGQFAQPTVASNVQMEALSQMFASMQQESGSQQQATLASTPNNHNMDYNNAHWQHSSNDHNNP